MNTPFRIYTGSVELDPLVVERFQQFGISESLFQAWIDLTFPPHSLKRNILIARAYDNLNGTCTAEEYPAPDDLPDFSPIE